MSRPSANPCRASRPARWRASARPRNTPTEIIETLNRQINAGLADPKMKARLADLGGTPIPGSPEDYGRLLAAEIEKWAKVIRAAHIKLE